MKGMQIGIRRADWLQRMVLCRLEVRCFGFERVLAGQWQRIGMTDVLAWTAHVDDEAAGLLIAYPHTIDGVVRPYIAVLGVVPQHRRCGLARQLLQTALDFHSTAWLHVRVSNAVAIALYESLHFTLVQRVANYYRDGEDALLMAKI